MDNLMQDFPLRVTSIIDHAAKYHPERKIISKDTKGTVTDTNYKNIHRNSKKVADGLQKLGVKKGDVIGVMAWNNHCHLEVWYGIPGIGAVNHNLNPRLFSEQLIYIINHANDKILIIDLDLVPIIEKIINDCPNVEKLVILCSKEDLPSTEFSEVISYEELLSMGNENFEWITGEETDACGICYTSGTTGNPKGVVYTHRSNTLHALTQAAPDMLNLSSSDTIMPVVPLFHANGWSIAYTAPLVGSSIVFPGGDLSPSSLYDMLEKGVTITAAVPTVWLLLLNFLESEKKELSSLKRVVIGGSSCPRSVIEDFQNKYGVRVLHAWGMTELSPLGTICSFKPEIESLNESDKLDIQETTGHPPFGVDLKIVDDDGKEIEWNGSTQGDLYCRGAAVVKRYLKMDELAVDSANWFNTGDVATIDKNGYMRITDRSKDVIKSGGEWISSIDLENAAVGHSDVAEAAAIGVPHPKWDERPVLVIVTNDGKDTDKNSIISHVSERVAKWQKPDDVIFVDEIPHTATGKISKLELRKLVANLDYKHPDLR